VELLKTFQNQWSLWKLSKTSGAFGNFSKPVELLETFQDTVWELSKTWGTCMAI
jgi:hypothetical protein